MGTSDVVDYDSFVSEAGKKWKPSPIRHLFPLENNPGMISFLAGKPHPVSFPFRFISFGISNSEQVCTIEGEELYNALQYLGTKNGTLSELTDWWESFCAAEHGRKRGDGWRSSVGAGSIDLIAKLWTTLLNPGDPLLVESPLFPGTIGATTQTDCIPMGVPCDNEGVIPDALDAMLSSWSSTYSTTPFPKVLYVNPTGNNPSGFCTSTSRKKEVLRVVKRWNLLLVEDEAYAFIYYGDPEKKPLSYFALDEVENKGRVLRLDSMSKCLAGGLRMGFLTGPTQILDIVDQHTTNFQLHSSATTQALVLKLLQTWGFEGFKAHCASVSKLYQAQRDMFEIAAQKYLNGLATWVTPVAGMFLFVKINLSGVEGKELDTTKLLSTTAIEKGVLVTPGSSFLPSESHSAYARISFSHSTPEEAEEGLRRLRDVILENRAQTSA